MTDRNERPARKRGWRSALRTAAALAGVASCVALVLDGAALLAERPERVSGAHEAAAQALARPDQSGGAPQREPDAYERHRDEDEREAAEARVVAVAGVFIESGIEEESLAAAMAALAIELATRAL